MNRKSNEDSCYHGLYISTDILRWVSSDQHTSLIAVGRAISADMLNAMSREKIASTVGKSVAIIGAGALGLVATKNLIEEGFEVTTFEKNTYVGGLWHATQDPLETSALLGTVSNGSKQTSAFSDFPMPNCKIYQFERPLTVTTVPEH